AVGEVGGGEEAGLPDVLVFQVAQRLGESEGENRDDTFDGGIGLDADDRVAGTDHAWTEERAGRRQEGRVRGDEFVRAREADDLVDAGAVFAFALDFREQGVDAGAGPGARQLRILQ